MKQNHTNNLHKTLEFDEILPLVKTETFFIFFSTFLSTSVNKVVAGKVSKPVLHAIVYCTTQWIFEFSLFDDVDYLVVKRLNSVCFLYAYDIFFYFLKMSHPFIPLQSLPICQSNIGMENIYAANNNNQ